MSKQNQSSIRRVFGKRAWAGTLPVLALTPLLLLSACVDSGVIGDDCPPDAKCQEPTAGTGNAGTGPSEAGTGSSSAGSVGAGGTSSTGTAGGASGGAANEGVICGGLLGASCAKSQFCLYSMDAQCGAADQTGICTPIPDSCDGNYAPVCGCDGKTYSNDCDAASHGISVAMASECAPSDASCGGRGGATCAANEYCKFEPAANCGRSDAAGICTPIPKDGGCIALFDPVCGCDGKTYGNSCEANRAGVSIDHVGECICGTIAGLGCADGYFCNYPLDMACGNADGAGVCTIKPKACDLVLDEVCGCDQKTYSNECAANMAGASISTKGACK